ncbi:MAG: PQQ-dependent sugar dehydrogenase [Deltaproteobacteria bacterium]|nr:PQQ-dependent sugar dehydrogenase [Deltaproteobacteria bacterium]
MRNRWILFFLALSTASFAYSCGSDSIQTTQSIPTPPSNPPIQNPNNSTSGCMGSEQAMSLLNKPQNPSGIRYVKTQPIQSDALLIDLEFLPQRNGDSILISKSGKVSYLKNDFIPLGNSFQLAVQNSGEQGLLNVIADPQYNENCLIYFYLSPQGGNLNRVIRAEVTSNISQNNFSLSDFQTIIEISKTGLNNSSSPGTNHNGGALLFDSTGALLIATGDGGGSASSNTVDNISQRSNTRLGKILRIIPSKTKGIGSFTIPSGNNSLSGALPEIYSYGLRNPFTMILSNHGILIGDVGLNSYEEINLLSQAGQNFGWPQVEGPVANPSYLDPVIGYNHSSDLIHHDYEDPENNGNGESIIALHYFDSNSYYAPFLSDEILYSDFFHGWVRSYHLTNHADRHLTHQEALTSLQKAPNGVLYGTSLGENQILRLDLIP